MTSTDRPLVIDSLGFLENPFDPTQMRANGIGARLSSDTIDSAVRSGLVATNLTVSAGEDYDSTVAAIAELDDTVAASGGRLRKVLSVADIDAARAEGSVGIIYGFQNAAMVGEDLSRVSTFHSLGVRVIQLTYNLQNQFGSGSLVAEDTGLTDLGAQLLDTLNEQKLIVDLSHGSYHLTMDVARASTSERPPSITHTGCAVLSATPRNKTDEELRAIADLGGYVGIYTMPFLAIGKAYSFADQVAHISHAIDICGEDLVGIGTDQGLCDLGDMEIVRKNYHDQVLERRAAGISAPGEDPAILPYPDGFSAPDKYRQLEQAMRDAGFSASRIEKVMGGNFRRYAAGIWGE